MSHYDIAAKAANENTQAGLSSTVLTDGNTAVKQEPEIQNLSGTNGFELPECLKNLSLEDIFEKCTLSDDELEKLKSNRANDNLPPMPTNPDQMTEFMAWVSKSVSAELAILKLEPLSEEEYLVRFQKLQIQASYQLVAECMIGEDIRQMKGCKGLKEKGKNTGKTTKKDMVQEKYPHLGSRMVRDFQKLFIPNVWEAIKIAFERGILPTRALALSAGIVKKARTESNQSRYTLKKWRAKDEDFAAEFKDPNSLGEIKACSLFCNIGIGTSLLEKSTNIKIVVANEKDPRRGKAHRRLYPNCETIIGGIDEKETFDKIVAANKKYGAKLLFASPPCQEATLLNTSKNKGKTHKAALFEDTLDMVKAVGYDYVFIENVPQWLTGRPEAALDTLGDKTIGEYVVDELEALGYNVTVGIVSAADYETAEDRERSIILACKKEFGVWKFPKKHKFRPTVFEVIGNMPSLEAGEVCPDLSWHYARDLMPHEIEFLAHTPTGCSAWDNAVKYQPLNKSGSNAGGQFNRGYLRINPAKSSPTITGDNGDIGGLSTVHFGRPLSDGTYSDARVLSILEVLRLIGAADEFLNPLNAPGSSEEDFDGLTWENGQLVNPDEAFIRGTLGEHVCPKFMLNIMSTLPLPANDNEADDEGDPVKLSANK